MIFPKQPFEGRVCGKIATVEIVEEIGVTPAGAIPECHWELLGGQCCRGAVKLRVLCIGVRLSKFGFDLNRQNNSSVLH